MLDAEEDVAMMLGEGVPACWSAIAWTSMSSVEAAPLAAAVENEVEGVR